MGKTNIKVFSTRNGSPLQSHLLDNVLEQLEEVLYKKVELFQPTSALGINVTPFGHNQVTPTLCKSLPTSPTLSKSSPAPRNLFDKDTERAMHKLDTMERRHVNLETMVLEIPPPRRAGPRTWRGTSPPTCLDSHAAVATIKPWAPGQQALSALSIDRSPSSSSRTTTIAATAFTQSQVLELPEYPFQNIRHPACKVLGRQGPIQSSQT
jgi:hypothetical protein